MKFWTLVAILGFFGTFIIFTACDNEIPNPIYESVTINLSTVKMEIVKTFIGEYSSDLNTSTYVTELIENNGVTDVVYFGSGAIFTAVVNGKNNPSQSILWEILENVDIGTNIINGILTVAVNDHGKKLTIKATSAVDSSKYDIKTIIVVNVLPFEFHGKWINASELTITVSNNEWKATLTTDSTNVRLWNTISSPIIWMPVINVGSEYDVIDYPCGFYVWGIVSEILELSERNIGDISPINSLRLLHSNKKYMTPGYEKIN